MRSTIHLLTLPTALAISLTLLTSPVMAVGASPTPTPRATLTPTPIAIPVDTTATDSVKQTIKDRVEKMKQTTDSTVKGIMTSLKQQKFGIVGMLEKNVGSTVQVRTLKGRLHVITIDKQAVILKANKPITREELELNSPITLMGFIGEDSTYTAKRVLISDDVTETPDRTTLFGKVSANTTKVFTITADEGPIDVKTSTKTQYLSLADTPIKRTDIKVNDSVLAVFASLRTATTSAARVYSFAPVVTPVIQAP